MSVGSAKIPTWIRPAARSRSAIDRSRYGTCVISSLSTARNALKITSGSPGVAAHRNRPPCVRTDATRSASDDASTSPVTPMVIDAVTTAAVGTRSRAGSNGIPWRINGVSVTCPAGVKSSVCLSLADTNACAPTMPSAPGRLSTITGCRQRSDKRGTRRRATMSAPVPAPNGTITVTGRDGHSPEVAAREQAGAALSKVIARTDT